MWIRIDGESGYHALYTLGAETPEEVTILTELAKFAYANNKFSLKRFGQDYPIAWGSHWDEKTTHVHWWTPEYTSCNRFTAYWFLTDELEEPLKFTNPIFQHPLWLTHIQPQIDRGEVDSEEFCDYWLE